MTTRGFFTKMFTEARERGVEGIVLFVRYANASSIRFVIAGRLIVYKFLTYREACEALESLKHHAGLSGRSEHGELQGQLLINICGATQLWRVYVIPGADGPEVLLRYQRPDKELEAIMGLPIEPYDTLDSRVCRAFEDREEVALASPGVNDLDQLRYQRINRLLVS